MVNKESPLNQGDLTNEAWVNQAQQQFKPVPLIYKGPADSTVDKVLITSNESENFLVKVSALQRLRFKFVVIV